MKWIGYIVLLCGIMSCQSGPTLSSEKFAYSVFAGGKFDYACYRTPAIIRANNNRLLAFAEARKNSCDDGGDVDIVMRSSRDEGKTWSDMIIVWSDSTNTCSSPTPVIDRQTGHIHLLATWHHGTDTQQQIEAGQSRDTRRVYLIRSNDDGLSWSYPREITPAVSQPNWSWYTTGPGSGHQITQGKYANRLIAGCTHKVSGSSSSSSHAIFSDDNGSTWQLGGIAPAEMVSNSEIAETSIGDLIMNMRSDDDSQSRKVATSTDGGASWQNITDDANLVGLSNQASLHTHKMEGHHAIVFSNPADPVERKSMTVRVSYDDGKTWDQSLQIGKSKSANSDLVTVDEGRLGILYEGGVNHPNEQVVYTRLPLDID